MGDTMVGCLVTLGSLVFDKQNLITVDGDSTLEEVLKVLKERNITYVVVVQNGKYSGFVSTIELMTELAFDKIDCKAKNCQFFKTPNKPVKELLKVNPSEQSIYCYEPTELLQVVYQPMSEGNRRVLVSMREAGHTYYRSLSQFDVICYIGSHFSVLKGQSPIDIEKSIEELGLCDLDNSKSMTVIHAEDEALKGFSALEQKELVAAPVVDSEGKVITSLSAADLRGMACETLKSVRQPTVEFLKNVRGDIGYPVTCVPSDSLKTCLARIISAKVNRLWITNSQQQPCGTLSVTKIIRLFKDHSKQCKECC